MKDPRMPEKDIIRRALMHEPMENLIDRTRSKYRASGTDRAETPPSKQPPITDHMSLSLSSVAKVLAYDIATYIDCQFTQRQKRLGLSARKLEKGKLELLRHGLITEVWIGKSLFLAPAARLFSELGIDSPYKRDVSSIHSFLTFLAARLIEPLPLVKYVKTEASLGDSNSTLDLLVERTDSQRWAYEITVSPSHVIANLAKLKNMAFSQVIVLCPSHAIKESVWPVIRNAGFDPDYFSTIRVQLFSGLIRQRNTHLRNTL